MTAPNESAPDHSAGWLGWLDGMTPEEWATQFAARPVVARPVVMPMAAEESAFRDELAARAQKITDRINRGEIGPGLPPGYRFDFTSTFPMPVPAAAPEPTPEGFLIPPGLAGELMQQLRDGFTALDAWYDSQVTPAGPEPWRRRLRRAWHRKAGQLRDRAARRAYKVIAGDWPDDGGDW